MKSQTQRQLLAFATVTLIGCGGPQHTPLIALENWRQLDSVHDPMPHAIGSDANARCKFGGIAIEADVREINTGRCPYALVGFPLQRELQAGATVRTLLSHGKLASTEPASGHVVLALAGQLLMDRSVVIPAAEHIYDDTLTVPADVSADELLVLHLHNHGANAWRLHLFEEE